MTELLTLFDLGEKSKAPTHAAYMRQTYGYAAAGLTCGQCCHFSQDTKETKREVIEDGEVKKVTVERGGCFHYTGGRVQSWKPDAVGYRLWEGR